MITGQIITQVADIESPKGYEYEMVSIVGIVSAPKGMFKDAHQYIIFGNPDILMIGVKQGVDVSEKIRSAVMLGDTLLLPIWRV